MKKTEKEIQKIQEKILESRILKEKNVIIAEMKKIGIEKLPYSYSSLKQFIDPETMKIHYSKHYLNYVNKLNDSLSKKKYGDLELIQIIKTISRFDKTIRDNAGGAFNHSLFWNMLSPTPTKLKGELHKKIIKQYGGFPQFKSEFEKIAKERFGSGWVWLILTSKNTLKIMSTPNQDNPLMNVIEGGGFPLLGLDLWEHAYYLKYRNKRDEYISNFWKVVNWDFVSKLYDMKMETKLLETTKMKQIISEGKSHMCSSSENEFYRNLFNTNQDVKWTYMHGINKIMKEVFAENYITNPQGNQMSGVYDLEKEGRSVINKLNTNYTAFCVLLGDLNKVITKVSKKQPIDFKNKTPQEQVKEVNRMVAALNYFKFRIFDKNSSTFQNLMKVLTERDAVGSKREEITAAILRRFFGKGVKVEIVGELGSKKDGIEGVDIEITKDGKTQTAQVKPYREKIITDNGISLQGTGSVKNYKTDLMIFQKGKSVLVFNEKPMIVNGNFLFPLDSLIYDIN